jgi:hypothetical protein
MLNPWSIYQPYFIELTKFVKEVGDSSESRRGIVHILIISANDREHTPDLYIHQELHKYNSNYNRRITYSSILPLNRSNRRLQSRNDSHLNFSILVHPVLTLER